MDKYYGFYRAKVVNNNDPDQFGRVLIWVPDIMPDIPDDQGIWARPANNPSGGRNTENSDECYYAGSSYIPPNGSWIWIFFEKNNLNRPYYFAALDIQNAKVLPENQLGSNPTKKWVILKSHEGRTLVISDDPDDARTEITGKKRNITEPPTGDTDSVYTIDDNQTTILFDERDGKEKILMRTYKGDFLHIDVDEQKLQGYFKNGIVLKTDGDFDVLAKNINLKATEELNLESTDNMNLKSIGDVNITSTDDMNLYAKKSVYVESVSAANLKSSSTIAEQANGLFSIKSSGVVAIDGSIINENGGASQPAGPASEASDAESANPVGDRNT